MIAILPISYFVINVVLTEYCELALRFQLHPSTTVEKCIALKMKTRRQKEKRRDREKQKAL